MTRALGFLLLTSAVACSSSSAPDPDGGADGGAPVPSDASAACPQPTGGPTTHAGFLAADETWTAAASPHVTTAELFIQPGVTVTIEPCAEVRIRSGNFLTVDGRLIARGSAARPIVIKNATEGERFASLRINTTGRAELAYVELSGGGAIPASSAGATIEVVGGPFPPVPSLLVEEVTVRGSGGLGVWMRTWSAFTPDSRGLTITGSGAIPEQPGYPLRVTLNAVGSIPSGAYSGNRRDEVQLFAEGAHYQSELDDRLRDRGVPYYMGGDGEFGRLEVVRSTLTLDPGVTVRFDTTGSNIGGMDIRAGGVLRAVGTAAAPIVLSASSDRRTPGAWEGLTFKEALGAGNQVEHVRIEFAGGHGGDSSFGCPPDTFDFATDAALKLFTEPTRSFLRDSVIADSSTHGIFEAWNGATVDFLGTNTFEGVVGCNQVSPKDSSGACPRDPPCPK